MAVRLPLRPDWSGVYFVCRLERVEVCKGSHRCPCPEPARTVRVPRADGPVRWRFVLDATDLECRRQGVKVLEYTDAVPQAGAVTITAVDCRVEVRFARYGRAEGTAVPPS